MRKQRLKHARSTSFKFEDRERFNDDKWKQRAIGGMRTFLIFEQPTQLRFCSKRFGRWIISWLLSDETMPDGTEILDKSGNCPLLQPQFRSCMLTQPFKLTWVRCVQQARSSSMADWQRVPYDKSNSCRAGRAPSLYKGSSDESVRYLHACNFNT